MLTSSPMPYHNILYKFFHSPQTKSLLTQKMQLHFLTNAIFEPNTASNLAVQILTYTKGYASVLSSHLFLVFGLNLAFAPKNKNQMHFRVDSKNSSCYFNLRKSKFLVYLDRGSFNAPPFVSVVIIKLRNILLP